MSKSEMFCFQCEQTARGTGCDKVGICGKEPKTAALQDLLVFALKGVGVYAHRARRFGIIDRGLDEFVVKALFNTLTNVNFDPIRIEALIREAVKRREDIRQRYEKACRAFRETPDEPRGASQWIPAESTIGLLQQAETASILIRRDLLSADISSTQELLTYGLKGLAAYADHAQVLGVRDASVYAFFHEALDALTRSDLDLEDLLELCLRLGEVNLRTMQLLDGANTGSYGNPTPTPVRLHPRKGKAILVSGHDLKDLEVLLQQTVGMGINIYTHGEMLPAHGYPGLKSIRTWWATTAAHGRIRQRNSKLFPAQS
jgi:hydroxylamine reductase